MTISSTVRTAGPYTGTGSVNTYPFAFKVFQASDLLAQQTDTSGNITTLVLTTNYSVTLNADQNASPGGSIVLNSNLPPGYKLILSSQVPELQGTSITNNGGFYPQVVENALDYLTILTQQLQTEVSQCMQLPLAIQSVSTTLPAPVAGMLLGWNVEGNAIINLTPTGVGAGSITGGAAGASGNIASDTITDVNVSPTAGIRASKLTIATPVGTGSVSYAMQSDLMDRISVKRFGAVGDGASHPASSMFATLAAAQAIYASCTALTDEIDALAALAARDYLQTNSDYRGSKIYFPKGHYILNRSLEFSPYDLLLNISLIGDGPMATSLDFSTLPSSTDGIVVDTNGTHFLLSDMTISGATRDNMVVGSGATTGGATYNSQIIVSNVRSQSASRHGINATNVYLTTIRDSWFKNNGGSGVVFNGYHTACQFTRCEASNNVSSGFSLNGMVYSGFDSCGSDNNTWGYSMTNMQGVVFKNCGAESNARDGFLLQTSTASATGIPVGVQDIHGVLFDGCVAITNSTSSAGAYGGFLGITTGDSRSADFTIHGGMSLANTTSDHALILSGASGSVICHKELFNDSSYTALDSITGSASVANATVTGQRMLVSLSVAQALTTGATTVVAVDTTQTNDLGGTLASGKITIPRGVNKVRVSASVDFAANGTGVRQLFLQHNGANMFGFPASAINAASAGDTVVSGVSAVLSVATGDTFNIQAYQNSGGNLNVNTGYNTWLCVEAIN